jgi:hypothetical protein
MDGPVGTALGHVGALPVEGIDEPHAVGFQPGAGVGVPLAEDEVVGPGHGQPVDDDGLRLGLRERTEILRRHT